MTFGIAIDPEAPLTQRGGGRTTASAGPSGDGATPSGTPEWAARGGRTRAGVEQYGQKLVWVLAHRYTEPGLKASLLKGRDRELARARSSTRSTARRRT